MKPCLYTILLALALSACAGSGSQRQGRTLSHPDFVADSAYACIADQVAMGPRVPGTPAHARCVDYLSTKLRGYGAEVEVLEGAMPDYEGRTQRVRNIVAHLGGDSLMDRPHVLLCAHYDSRPWCDEDTEDYLSEGVPAANDGASGVAVLLECARQLSARPLSTPVTIVLFDCEDMGTPRFYSGGDRPNSWCLGSQLWAREQIGTVSYQYGILLDMVGAPGAQFGREYYSDQYASNYVDELWRNAAALGYGNMFVDRSIGAITDDHYYVNSLAEIPCVDIIHYDMQRGGFPDWWHTHRDNLDAIDRTTLQSVGETVLTMVL